MAPTPQEHSLQVEPGRDLDGNSVVISGMSGIFPECNNVKEFSEKLYNHENMVSSDKCRWKLDHPELTSYCGNVPQLDRFDAQFFMVHYRLANSMDSMSKKLLENAYQAIYDAGMSPHEVYGKNVGVFIGTCLTETEKVSAYSHVGSGIVGCNRAMFSNRISYFLNAKGPSMTIDAACSGSMVCLERAYMALSSGECDSAIVGGSNIHLHPQSCIHYSRMLKINPDGKTKSFDKNADGQSPAECIGIVFLQKAKDAKRIYAKVCKAKTQFSILDDKHYDHFGPIRDPAVLTNFISEFYLDTKVNPKDVEYVEAYGSAFADADEVELKVLDKVYCKNRTGPLYIGSVMSNMGYSQASTAVAALTKVLLAYHTGKISANINYNNPRDDVDAIREGRLRVVDENRPFKRSYTAINSLSLTGINGHVLLQGQYKQKDISRYKSNIPYLITISGRQESAVEKIFNDIKSRSLDPEEIALIHNIHKIRVSKHLARGFTILESNGNETSCLKENVDYYDDAKRPLWFVYSGMGSQWNGMGTQLLKIPIFAKAIHKCHEVLKTKNLDLMHILTSDDPMIFENILNSFVGIAAVQIGLTDLLLAMDLVPDNIIGHSVGELGCAYADGCLTAEEMILSAYYRGKVSLDTELIRGSMAAVGMGYQQVSGLCPPEIEVACHNAPESSTISGPAEKMREFVKELTKKGIFAKEVNCSNIAYHSRYIKDAGPSLLNFLKQLIKSPNQRSKKWLSTSVPEERWGESTAQTCSAEYLVNNLLNPVLFEETAKYIPENAVLIEVAPHGLLQAILKRFLPTTCTNLPLTRRGNQDNVLFLLESIGNVYMAGYNPDVSVLYPQVEFPVSTETRSLSHLVEWVYTEKWTLPLYVTAERTHAAEYDIALSTQDDENSFLKGHIIHDTMRFPFAGALVYVWDTLAMSMEVTRKEISVQFREVHFHTQPELNNDHLLRLRVEIHRGNGSFQVLSENILVATGFIITATAEAFGKTRQRQISVSKDISTNDVYRVFYEKGYDYKGEFRSIKRANDEMDQAFITWNNSWVTLIDGMIQMNAYREDSKALLLPRYIHRLYIDVKEQNIASVVSTEGQCFQCDIFEDLRLTRCAGIIIENLKFKTEIPKTTHKFVTKNLKFIPFANHKIDDISTALDVYLQIVAENINGSKLNAIDLSVDHALAEEINNLVAGIPNMEIAFQNMDRSQISKAKVDPKKPYLILATNLLNYISHTKEQIVLPQNSFIISLEKSVTVDTKFSAISSTKTKLGILILARWRPKPDSKSASSFVTVTSVNDLSFLKATRNDLLLDARLVVLTHYPPIEELKDLVRQWRQEETRNEIYMVVVNKKDVQSLQGKEFPAFDLTYNVLNEGVWGGYYYVHDYSGKQKEDCNVALTSAEIGNVKSLHWTQVEEPNPKSIVVTVQYAGLNYYDAKKAMGNTIVKDSDILQNVYGMDFSGIDKRGERVMGVIQGGAVSRRVAADLSLVWPVPCHWSMEDAATVPLPYAHALYILGIKCRLIKGMTLLVHGASGALGQAVISIALAHGCDVFATVSDYKKKRFLKSIFPQIPDNCIGNSRDLTFSDMVLNATKGEGCDIVISCVQDPVLKDATLACCAPSGFTMDTHQVHSKDNYQYGMFYMTKSRSYIAVDFAAMFEKESYLEMEKIQEMLSEGIARGYVKPLNRVVYGVNDAERALRLLSSSGHRGRVVMKIQGEHLTATSRLSISASGSHLVIASPGDDELAIRVVDLLVSRGAQNIIFNRNGKNNASEKYLQNKIRSWQNSNIKVQVTNEKLATMNEAEKLVKKTVSMGPLDGIYTVVSKPMDVTVKNNLTHILNNVDTVSRKECPKLKCFSVITNNTDFGREVCQNRILQGYPAVVLQLLHVNTFDEFGEVDDDLVEHNTSKMSIENALKVIEDILDSTQSVSLAYSSKLPESRLIDEVSRIIGLNIPESTDESNSLEHLGLSEEKSKEFCNVLQQVNVAMSEAKVLQMTIKDLKNIQNQWDMSKKKVVTGLEILYSNVDTNELLATADVVFIPTAAQKCAMRDDEFDCNADYIVLIPGMDGHHARFQQLCERLKLPAAILQPGLDFPNETVTEMAERMVKVMLKKIKPKEMFYLLGYSFGVLVALEMAQILEDKGYRGVVYCVDASPYTFPLTLENLLRNAGLTNRITLQNSLVQHMYTLMAGKPSEQLREDLNLAECWDDRVEAGMKALRRNRIPYSIQYARSLVKAAHARIEQARKYNDRILIHRPLQSRVVVMRSRHQPAEFAADLNMARYTQNPTHVYTLKLDHAEALNDLRCANIVSKHLDASILEIFNKKNLCNTYLLNANTYTQFSADYD